MGQTDVDHHSRVLKWVAFVLPTLMVAFVIILVFADRRLSTFEDALRFKFPVNESVVDPLSLNPVRGQIIYVPVYSHVYHQDGRSLLLTITLSVRNTSIDHDIVVKSVKYFDTKGNEVKSFLPNPLRLPALSTTEFLVERDDTAGGSGANFLVEWVADDPVTEPIVDAVMIDTHGQQGISFARTGRVVREIVSAADGADRRE